MLDLEEIRKEDMANGRFDIYTDDIDFTDEQYTELRLKDKVRVSSINPVDIENSAIFEHIKKVTDYIKRVADAVLPNGYRVIDNKIMSYVKVILNEVHKNPYALENVSEELFKENYLLEAILFRDVITRANAYKLQYGDDADDDVLGALYAEFTIREEIVKRKKYRQRNFSKNIVVKRTDEVLNHDDRYDVSKIHLDDEY